ncbi:hypothetical protein DPX16_15795 [Anabarilius grahami]|uniref:Uncharacterized protein n=1 Tax=Anabarilius grahami TaxID=495550 RepID=A0A3N0YTE8_ANAGA|nr:hypothetical protein DPX16_15795 [Anabarilius grahami]
MSQAADLPLVRMDTPVRIKMEEDDGYAWAANMFGVHTASVPSHFKASFVKKEPCEAAAAGARYMDGLAVGSWACHLDDGDNSSCKAPPTFLKHKKAICKTVMDELRRTGKSPYDMANQLNEALHLRYERAHLAYLSTFKNVLDGDSGLYGQQTITGALRATNTPAPFDEYGDVVGWCGVTVSAHYLVDCLIQEYHRQRAHSICSSKARLDKP